MFMSSGGIFFVAVLQFGQSNVERWTGLFLGEQQFMDNWTPASDIYDDKAELDGSPKEEEEEEEEKGCSEVRTP